MSVDINYLGGTGDRHKKIKALSQRAHDAIERATIAAVNGDQSVTSLTREMKRQTKEFSKTACKKEQALQERCASTLRAHPVCAVGALALLTGLAAAAYHRRSL